MVKLIEGGFKMKKLPLVLLSLFLISLLGITVFLSDSELEKKSAAIMEQANGKDVSNLLILKDSPVSNVGNRQEVIDFGSDTFFYTDKYFFKGSHFQSFGLGATIYLEKINEHHLEEQKSDEYTKKINIRDVDAFYTAGEMNSEIGLMYHELSFLKDNIYYLITCTYLLDETKEDTFDFIGFLEDNLVPIEASTNL